VSARLERPAAPAPLFSAVLCGVERSADGRAAHDQAVLLASPGGRVERAPAPRLTRHGDRALQRACDGHDLLVLGAGAGASAAVEHAPIPVLVARWCLPGTDLTDTILVAVDDSPASSRAVELAGRLAAAHGGTVTILAAPLGDPACRRAIAAGRRILLRITGAAPRVLGEQPPREHAVPSAAAALTASLVVLGTDRSQSAKRMTAQIAGQVGCSVLTVPPPPAPISGRRVRRPARPRVLIAGGGIAGLETLLALHALAADRVEVTLLAPELTFVHRSIAVDRLFRRRRVRRLRLKDTAAAFGAGWRHGALDRVEAQRHRAVTKDDHELPYDVLVLAIGARPVCDWQTRGVLTYRDERDGPGYGLLLHRLREGRIDKVAFVKPAGPNWPLALYDLALMTAADCAAHERADVELSLVTPEPQPLAIFGRPVGAAVRGLLDEAGVALHTSSYGVPGRPGWLDISPGERHLPVDRIVTQPRLAGPRLRGIPCGHDGFLPADAHGRLAGLDGVFAAGDATTFPVKQGGLAAQQGDAVAEAIAATVVPAIDPQPFRPTLRGLLPTGDGRRYLRADISGAAGDDSTISEQALWWPPHGLCGRHLGRYLVGQVDCAADVLPWDERAIPVESPLDRAAPGRQRTSGELHPSSAAEHRLARSER
jgi:sulfide:quinone oxidoreductase